MQFTYIDIKMTWHIVQFDENLGKVPDLQAEKLINRSYHRFILNRYLPHHVNIYMPK